MKAWWRAGRASREIGAYDESRRYLMRGEIIADSAMKQRIVDEMAMLDATEETLHVIGPLKAGGKFADALSALRQLSGPASATERVQFELLDLLMLTMQGQTVAAVVVDICEEAVGLCDVLLWHDAYILRGKVAQLELVKAMRCWCVRPRAIARVRASVH